MDYTVKLNVKNKKCVIIGGGRAAAIKAAGLAAAGADVYITAPKICGECRINGVTLNEREYRSSDTDGAFLVFALTGNPALDCDIETQALKSGALIGGSDFAPAASRSGENISVTVSTGFPALSVRLADRLLSYDRAAGLLAAFRKKVIADTPDETARRARLAAAVTDEMLDLALSDPERFIERLSSL